jgi:hypothetical protein
MAKPKTISFEYEGEKYTLEFNRETYEKTEKAGVTISRIENLAENPYDAVEVIPELWFRAFQMHHPDITRDKADEMYHSMADKGGEDDLGLIGALTEIFVEPVAILFKEPGNTKWSKSW